MVETDDRCRRSRDQALAFEDTLRAALEVPVTQGLSEGIVLHQSTSLRRERSSWLRYGGLGMAAIVLLGLSLLLVSPERSIANNMIAHFQHEHAALTSREVVADDDVRWLFSEYGAELVARIGTVTYLRRCPMLRDSGVHMVMQTAEGPVTVFYMPGEHVADHIPVRSEGLEGFVIGMEGAALTLIGKPGQSLQSEERTLRRAIQRSG